MSRFCDENKVKVCKFGEHERLDNRENGIYILKSMFWEKKASKT